MAYLTNEPAAFASEARRGLLLAYPHLLRPVPGGVATAFATPKKVAVVIGGGSGHYPAFAGLVGPGLADAAVMGNVFASPSARQVVSVARAVENGEGVLLCYGNYTGDAMSFDAARDELDAAGIPTRCVRVTDDIASAPMGAEVERRGIAGDLLVFKIAAAAAAAGCSLDQVTAAAEAANAVTRTLGVAFQGASIPGAVEPLFRIDAGQMAVGMGIHGEPGLSQAAAVPARELAHLLLTRLLKEVPSTSDTNLVLVVNGLGAVKQEELFVLLQDIHGVAGELDVAIADSKVGEFVTSFEMAGVSLTAASLDDEQFAWWRAPATTPAFVVLPEATGMTPVSDVVPERETRGDAKEEWMPQLSERQRAQSAAVARCLDATHLAVQEAHEELGRLDALAGDGDHGIGMLRGATAASHFAAEHGDSLAASVLLAGAADAWEDAAGGTSGALWGALLRAISQSLPVDGYDGGDVLGEAAVAATRAVEAFGAQPGDRTMLDPLIAWRDALSQTPREPLTARLSQAARIATEAAMRTATMTPRRGRARTHAGRALGAPDAGAMSFALIAKAISRVDGLDDQQQEGTDVV